jgi:putative photosynthetic complex assembly protein 2
MALILATALVATLAWWGSTGLIVLAVRQFDQRRNVVIICAAIIAAIGLGVIIASADAASPSGAFAAFGGALALWAFFEVTFLFGWITGPRRVALPAVCSPLERFRHAAATVIHHEAGLALTLAGLAAFLQDAPNRVALMTFLVLWAMRLCAKFILFLGARHSFSELMPARLAYMQSYFRTDRTTLLFPFVLAAGLAVFVALVLVIRQETNDHVIVAHTLAATFLALALSELVLLNLPIRDSALWAWALPKIAAGAAVPPPVLPEKH